MWLPGNQFFKLEKIVDILSPYVYISITLYIYIYSIGTDNRTWGSVADYFLFLRGVGNLNIF